MRHEENPAGYVPPTMRGNHPMSALLQNVIGGMDSAGQIHESLALAYWARAVGAQAAAATEADAVRDGVLFVRTKSSVWSHELTLHKARLLQNLNRMLGGKVITEIVFKAQGLTRQAKPEPEPDAPTGEELAAIILEPGERAELRARLEKLFTIEDDRIRTAIANRMTQEAKLRHWRMEHGWKLCPRCSAAHKTEYAICPHCRLNT